MKSPRNHSGTDSAATTSAAAAIRFGTSRGPSAGAAIVVAEVVLIAQTVRASSELNRPPGRASRIASTSTSITAL